MSFLKQTGKAIGDVIPGIGHYTFDPTVGKVFIPSGTGALGYRVAMSLIKAGHKDVRVGVWKGDRVRADNLGNEINFGGMCAVKLAEAGADVIDFDWSNPDDYEKALKNVKTVFCSLPHINGWAEVFPAFLLACKEHKVEHFVKISFLRPTHAFKGVTETAKQYRENVPFVKFHCTCDDLLEQAKSDSRISYTILATSHLMSSPLHAQGDKLRKDHMYFSASYGMGVNYVSPNDVADAAVVVLLNQKPFRNKTFNLTGPGPTTDKEVARLLSAAYGTPIQHVELGYHDYVKTVEERGLPEWMAKDVSAFERMKASGVDEHKSSYTNDLTMITGKPAESFRDYLSHTSSMRPGMAFP